MAEDKIGVQGVRISRPDQPFVPNAGGTATGRPLLDLSGLDHDGPEQRQMISPQPTEATRVIRNALAHQPPPPAEAPAAGPQQAQATERYAIQPAPAETRDYASINLRMTTRGPAWEVKVVNADPHQAAADALAIYATLAREIGKG